MKSNNNQSNGKQNKPKNMQNNKNVPAQQDGFRYDYNDSSDFKDNENI